MLRVMPSIRKFDFHKTHFSKSTENFFMAQKQINDHMVLLWMDNFYKQGDSPPDPINNKMQPPALGLGD